MEKILTRLKFKDIIFFIFILIYYLGYFILSSLILYLYFTYLCTFYLFIFIIVTILKKGINQISCSNGKYISNSLNLNMILVMLTQNGECMLNSYLLYTFSIKIKKKKIF